MTSGPFPLRSTMHRVALRCVRVLPAILQHAVARQLTPSYRLGVHIVLTDPDGRILLVRQPYRSRWYLPGGALRRGETFVQAAERELREETGLEIELTDIRGDIVQSVASRWITWVSCITLTPVPAASVRPSSPEITQCAWFGPGELPPIEPSIRRALAVAKGPSYGEPV
jgi:8-oxo-dGTP diphosphatase